MDRRQVIGSGAAAAALALGGGAAAASGPVASTRYGKVRGAVVENGVKVFKGVPYGAPTGGERRFRPPQPPQPWTEVREALAFGDQSPQLPPAPTPMFNSWDRAVGESEDCLRLNVWTPNLDARKRPVMVWFHGGGFAQYNGSATAYDGERLCKRGDVVLVTVNHRLNVFGYLYLEELGGQAWAGSANCGQLDLVAALQWVKDNIAAFGGDPGNVTIFGESGGGAKVCALMAMPAAQGLFHKAIVQSGPFINGVSKASATEAAKALLAAAKVSSAGELAALPTDQVLAALKALPEMRRWSFAPVVDGTTLPRDPFDPDAPDVSASVPLIIGTNTDEMTLLAGSPITFGLDFNSLPVALATLLRGTDVDQVIDDYRKIRPQASAPDVFFGITTQLFMAMGSVRIAERKAAQGRAPVYMYELAWNTPVQGGRLKAPHALEIPFVFDTVAKSPSAVGTGKEPQLMADQMSPAWVAFARTGVPAARTLPPWPAYNATDRQTMVFNLTSKVVSDPHGDERAVLKDIPPIGMAR